VYRVLDRPDEVSRTDERLKYVPASAAADWPWVLEFLQAGRSADQAAEWRELFQHRLALVGALDGAGVAVLAGTDAGDVPYIFPGFSLHDELALLVTAGFTPMQALQAATLEPARFLGMERSLGTVEGGKLADLVVLDADPLADIANTTQIHAVLVRGQLISPERRTRMLADVEQAAQEQTDPGPSTARRIAECCHAVTVR
jgi:imidazolonepropionase-like amidohydrolase